MSRSLAILFVILAGGMVQADSPRAAEKAREGFAASVRPLLNQHCFRCHNSEKARRDLDLTRLETLLRGGRSGAPIVPGKSSESLLWKVLQTDHRPHMPPKVQLERAEIDAVARWIDSLPAGASPGSLAGNGTHWAFRAPERPAVPEVRGEARTPIDAFVLARLEEHGLGLAPEASRVDLIRRASFDLTGLPPTPEEVDAFLLDASPRAFETVVDRLLASPHHGERWARHWLDLARFAESEGFKSDETRPHAWRWRDWVIDSLNEDKPYDRFLLEQVAGDELWPEDPRARLATAFHRHYPDESNARDLFQRRQEILNDITDTVGSAFLGLTLGCARCHDHKYDPVSQADYYRLQAFFAGVRAVDDLPLAPADDARRHRDKMAAWEERTRSITSEMAVLEEKKRVQIARDNLEKFPAEIQAAINKPEKERTPLDWQMVHKARPYLYPDRGTLSAALGGEEKKRWQALNAKLEEFRGLHPGELALGSAIADAGREAPRTFLLAGGAHQSPREEVEPGFPASIDPASPRIEPPAGLPSSGRRAALGRWLADPRNPLTARVMVNRVWQHHFGRGIVGTPSDFGTLGDPPTHPELLDWLALEFAESGFRLKALHKLIVTSAVYRQSSRFREDAARIDPQGRLLWRFPRRRLEAEAVRDAVLAAAGILDGRVGGPSVFPDLPPGVSIYPKWTASRDPQDRNRRSIYIFVRRNARYPLLEAFDFPDTHESCGRRHATISAPQALMMLNGALVLDAARSFAGRVLREAGSPSREAWIGRAWRIAYGRSPEHAEREAAMAFLEGQREIVAARIAAGEEIAAPARAPEDVKDAAEGAALVDLCHTLLSSNEFIDLP